MGVGMLRRGVAPGLLGRRRNNLNSILDKLNSILDKLNSILDKLDLRLRYLQYSWHLACWGAGAGATRAVGGAAADGQRDSDVGLGR